MEDFNQNRVFYDDLAIAAGKQLIANGNYSKIFILVDENTKEHCLPFFLDWFEINPDELISVPAGEDYKTIETCLSVWTKLSELGADRKSLLINLGGGVLTDLGGFVASTFKRGMHFINIPTTLLAMVDASVGGKTGVDLGVLKNQIGVINQAELVLVFPEFLKTLDYEQLRSGFAEMLKHALIANGGLWEPLQSLFPNVTSDYIKDSVAVKEKIVEKDPFENNERKKLNFGHTLGHAIESYFLGNPERTTLLHGEAIAIGMIMESYLSFKTKGLSKVQLDDITRTILDLFPKVEIAKSDIPTIIELLKHDKKNTHGNINFTLLTGIGYSVIDVKVSNKLLHDSFLYYNKA